MDKKKIFALGFFDGVHLGHQALLEACCDLSQKMGLQSAVLTFDTHPQSLVSGQAPVLINHSADRAWLLRAFGIHRVYTVRFDRQTMSMPWQEFFRHLVEEYGAAGVVCGDDFRFGYKGEGNAQKLCEACAEAGIPCVVVPERTCAGIRVSSTHIRGLITSGQMEQAVTFLGHPHILSGEVVSGRRLGRTIGVPTANLLLPEGVVVPQFGVYACRILVDGCEYMAVTNVGTRPTVGGHRVTVEPWILDFEGDLYGKTVTLQFHSFLRSEEKFPSLEALQDEILKNARQTREFFKNN